MISISYCVPVPPAAMVALRADMINLMFARCEQELALAGAGLMVTANIASVKQFKSLLGHLKTTNRTISTFATLTYNTSEEIVGLAEFGCQEITSLVRSLLPHYWFFLMVQIKVD